jgi:hypothetical protein
MKKKIRTSSRKFPQRRTGDKEDSKAENKCQWALTSGRLSLEHERVPGETECTRTRFVKLYLGCGRSSDAGVHIDDMGA